VLRWAMVHGAPVFPSRVQWYEHLLRGEPHAMDHLRTNNVKLATFSQESNRSPQIRLI
jgi:hypothetical protein